MHKEWHAETWNKWSRSCIHCEKTMPTKIESANDWSTAPWDSAFVYDNINDVWNHWSEFYKDIIDKHAPIVKKRVHANQLPWINVQIKRAIRLRNKQYRKYRLSRNDETWESYRVQRNLVTKLKRISIKRFLLDSSANTTTPGDFWKRVKPLLRLLDKITAMAHA